MPAEYFTTAGGAWHDADATTCTYYGTWPATTAATHPYALFTGPAAATTWTWATGMGRWRRVLHIDRVLRDDIRCAVVARWEGEVIEADDRTRRVPDIFVSRRGGREEASRKATALLLRHLDPVQRAEFEEFRRITVIVETGVRYRLNLGRVANVQEIDEAGEVRNILCAHPAPDVPDADTLLAQKLMLETDPARFLRVANRHPVRARDAPRPEAVAAAS